MKSYKMSLNGTELIYDINEHCVLLGNRRLQLNKDEIFPRPKISLYIIIGQANIATMYKIHPDILYTLGVRINN